MTTFNHVPFVGQIGEERGPNFGKEIGFVREMGSSSVLENRLRPDLGERDSPTGSPLPQMTNKHREGESVVSCLQSKPALTDREIEKDNFIERSKQAISDNLQLRYRGEPNRVGIPSSRGCFLSSRRLYQSLRAFQVCTID